MDSSRSRVIGAHLPHPHSDLVRMEMYGATVRCRARDVRLVLPESEDVVVDVYSALGRPNDDPHWADLWQWSGGRGERRYSPSRNSCEWEAGDRFRVWIEDRWDRGGDGGGEGGGDDG